MGVMRRRTENTTSKAFARKDWVEKKTVFPGAKKVPGSWVRPDRGKAKRNSSRKASGLSRGAKGFITASSKPKELDPRLPTFIKVYQKSRRRDFAERGGKKPTRGEARFRAEGIDSIAPRKARRAACPEDERRRLLATVAQRSKD